MNKKQQTKVIVGAIILFASILVLLNFQTLKDFFKAASFQPSEKLLAVEKNLNLTDRGKTVFRASTPALDSRDEFNQKCDVSRSETSVLGCYINSEIHIFNIESAEFPGIIESTSAHELLHAVWARMDEKEKANFTPTLKSVLESSDENFKKSLEPYDESSKLEEIYVRSATQIKNLPDSLEKHFSDIFKDQDSLVGYYESYIQPFSELEKTLDNLSNELETLKTKIDAETTDYTSRAETFASEVAKFNSCAETPNCFSNATFTARRAELLAEQNALNQLYSSLDSNITTYNQKIDQYNEKVIYGKNLQSIINSNPKPKESV